MVLPVAREEDDRHLAAFSHPWGIAGRAVRRDEQLRLFVLEFERIPERGTSDDSNDGRRHGKRTRSHRAIKLPSPTHRLGPIRRDTTGRFRPRDQSAAISLRGDRRSDTNTTGPP